MILKVFDDLNYILDGKKETWLSMALPDADSLWMWLQLKKCGDFLHCKISNMYT